MVSSGELLTYVANVPEMISVYTCLIDRVHKTLLNLESVAHDGS